MEGCISSMDKNLHGKVVSSMFNGSDGPITRLRYPCHFMGCNVSDKGFVRPLHQGLHAELLQCVMYPTIRICINHSLITLGLAPLGREITAFDVHTLPYPAFSPISYLGKNAL